MSFHIQYATCLNAVLQLYKQHEPRRRTSRLVLQHFSEERFLSGRKKSHCNLFLIAMATHLPSYFIAFVHEIFCINRVARGMPRKNTINCFPSTSLRNKGNMPKQGKRLLNLGNRFYLVGSGRAPVEMPYLVILIKLFLKFCNSSSITYITGVAAVNMPLE